MNISGFLVASILLTLSPGPDLIFVVTQSMVQGKKAGIFTALGLCTGLIVHTAVAGFGLAIVLKEYPLIFQVIKWGGAMYLIYLGLQAVREIINPEKKISKSSYRVHADLYRKGIIMNLLNPKVALFFLAFLPQFIQPGWLSNSLQMIILGILFIFQALLIFIIASLFGAGISGFLFGNNPVIKVMNGAKALVFISIGIFLGLDIF